MMRGFKSTSCAGGRVAGAAGGRGPWARRNLGLAVGAMDAAKVASSRRVFPPTRGVAKLPRGGLDQLEEEGCEVEDLFGQLWLVPQLRKARVSHLNSNPVWIHRDLWESRKFGAKDCHLVHEGDMLRSDLKQGSFAKDI
jgi:hypothetical protein